MILRFNWWNLVTRYKSKESLLNLKFTQIKRSWRKYNFFSLLSKFQQYHYQSLAWEYFPDTFSIRSVSFGHKGRSSSDFWGRSRFSLCGVSTYGSWKKIPKNGCTKAELATLELQEQSLFDPCESFEEYGQLNWKGRNK